MTPFRILFHWLCAAFAFGVSVSLFGAGEIDVAVPIFLAGVALLFIDFIGEDKE